MLIPATWIMPREGRRPADVRTAPPSGIGPWRATSQNGLIRPRRLIAPETPCGNNSHQGMMSVPRINNYFYGLVEKGHHP